MSLLPSQSSQGAVCCAGCFRLPRESEAPWWQDRSLGYYLCPKCHEIEATGEA